MDEQELEQATDRAMAAIDQFAAVRDRCRVYFKDNEDALPQLGREETLALAHYIASNPLIPVSSREVKAIQRSDPTEAPFILMAIFFTWGYMQAVDDLHQERLVV